MKNVYDIALPLIEGAVSHARALGHRMVFVSVMKRGGGWCNKLWDLGDAPRIAFELLLIRQSYKDVCVFEFYGCPSFIALSAPPAEWYASLPEPRLLVEVAQYDDDVIRV